MTGRVYDDFFHLRAGMLDKVISRIESGIEAVPPSLVSDLSDLTPEAAKGEALRTSLSLFLQGVHHLKDGAPGGSPGSLTGALSKASLRNAPLATAFGVRPPQFEPILLKADYTDGREAALYTCRRLIDAAEGDVCKSSQIITRRIDEDKMKNDEYLRRQAIMSFNTLLDVYVDTCKKLREDLAGY